MSIRSSVSVGDGGLTVRRAVRFADVALHPREAAPGGERFVREQLTFWDIEERIDAVLLAARPLLHAAGQLAFSRVGVHLWSGLGQVELTVDADVVRAGLPGLHDSARMATRPLAGALCEAVESPGLTAVRVFVL